MEQPKLIATEQEIALGHDIILKELGEGFSLEYGTFPHNKGIKGDEGVFGETLMIVAHGPEFLKFFVENYELFGRVSQRLCNELQSVTKVLFDITPTLPPADQTEG